MYRLVDKQKKTIYFFKEKMIMIKKVKLEGGTIDVEFIVFITLLTIYATIIGFGPFFIAV